MHAVARSESARLAYTVGMNGTSFRIRTRSSLLLLSLTLFFEGCREPAPVPKPSKQPAPVGFRHAPGSFGVFAGRVPLRRPVARWTFRTDAPIVSTPLWAGESIFVGGGDTFFYALDAATGATRWKVGLGAAVDGSPVWVDGRVVVAARDRTLRAFDSASGADAWRFTFGADIPFETRVEGWDFFLSTPTFAEGGLFVGGGDGNVYRLDPATGKEVWRFATAARVRSSPEVVGGIVYVGSFDGHLYALDAESGELRWKFATQGVGFDSAAAGFDRRSIQGSPAISGDVVVVGARDGFLYGVDRQSGRERWHVDHQISWVIGSPSVRDGIAYVGSSDGRFFHAVEVASGRELWRRPMPMNVFSSAALVGEVALVGCHDGSLFALEMKTGRELWRVETGDIVIASPVVRDGVILLASMDGTLIALETDPTAGPPSRARRAVFADLKYPAIFAPGMFTLRDRLARESYEVLDGARLVTFLRDRIADREPSVVVFASDLVPAEIEAPADGGPLVRRYLEAGGKIVWLGAPPFALTYDVEKRQITGFDPERSRPILGVVEAFLRGAFQIRASPLGKSWGLPAWWVGELGAPANEVEPLAEPFVMPEGQLAAAWVKRFGGALGTGFVRLPARSAGPLDPELILRVAEQGLP